MCGVLLSPVLGPVERVIYRICAVDESEEQHWVTYTVVMLAFSIAGNRFCETSRSMGPKWTSE